MFELRLLHEGDLYTRATNRRGNTVMETNTFKSIQNTFMNTEFKKYLEEYSK